MRILKFKVNAQKISIDEKCDFSNITKGTKGYLYAEFKLSKEYDGCGKIAVFKTFENEYPAILDNNNRCEIPEDALKWNIFKVKIIGVREGYRIQSNYTEVKQDG